MSIVQAVLVALVVGGAVAFGATRRQKVGTFAGIPYDWRLPTASVIRERFWNPGDPRVLTPKVFGWGWSINLAALVARLRGR
jgi:hypothetical protein